MRQVSALVVFLLACLCISCSHADDPVSDDPMNPYPRSRGAEYDLPDYYGELYTTDLIAGQDFENPVGQVLVANDGDNLYFQILMTEPWMVGETHLAVAEELDGIPHNKNWNPKVGQFAYDSEDYVPLSTFTEGTEYLYVALHAEAKKIDENGNIIQEESAWANGIDMDGNSWAMYFIYEIQPEPLPTCGGWAHSFGGSNVDVGLNVAVDAFGNAYVTGLFQSSVNFNPAGSTILSSNGSYDVFLAKYDCEGNLIWARSWGDSGNESGHCIDVSNEGYVAVGGHFSGTVDFSSDGSAILTSEGGYDAFICVFDLDGNFLWAQSWGGSGADVAYGVALDSVGGLYAAGYFSDTAYFDASNQSSLNSVGSNDACIAKYDMLGNLTWAQGFGYTGMDRIHDLGATADGTIFACGIFDDQIDLDPDETGSAVFTSNGAHDCFLSSLDSDGYYLWGTTWGSSADLDSAHAISVDSSNVYLTGWFYGTSPVDFDPDPVSQCSLTGNGERDAYIVSYDHSGDFRWAKSWGAGDCDEGISVSVNDTGNLFVSGEFRSSVDFNPGGGSAVASNGGCDTFISCFSTSGNYQWTRTWGGSLNEEGWGVASDPFGGVYITGRLASQNVEFAPLDCGASSDIESTSGSNDIYLTRYLDDGCW